MKTLSNILENKSEQRVVESINDKKAFSKYVHERFSKNKNYNRVSVAMVIESVLDAYPNDFQKAIEKLENF